MKTSKSESTFLKTEIKKISVSIKNDIFRKKMKKCSNEVPIIPSKTLSFAHKQCFPKQFQNVDVQIWGQDPHFFSEIPKKTFSQPPPAHRVKVTFRPTFLWAWPRFSGPGGWKVGHGKLGFLWNRTFLPFDIIVIFLYRKGFHSQESLLGFLFVLLSPLEGRFSVKFI
jgi:hypothetical protein